MEIIKLSNEDTAIGPQKPNLLEVLRGLLKEAEDLELGKSILHNTPEEVAVAQIIQEKYCQQGFLCDAAAGRIGKYRSSGTVSGRLSERTGEKLAEGMVRKTRRGSSVEWNLTKSLLTVQEVLGGCRLSSAYSMHSLSRLRFSN